MKTCVTSYSFGGYFSEERLGYLGILDKAKEFGFDGVEYVDGGYMEKPDAAKRIRERTGELGIVLFLFRAVQVPIRLGHWQRVV